MQLTKYIRVTGEIDSKFVEFDFAIGDPTLFVELVLPKSAFTDFCNKNHVVTMTKEQEEFNDAQEDKWRYGIEPTMVRHALKEQTDDYQGEYP